jgi:uncharacterized membrane protein YgcG
MKRTISTALAAVAILGAVALAQAPSGGPGIHDRAKMFSSAAVTKAEQVLREVEATGRWQVLIETRDTFGDRQPKEVAVENAKKANIRGLSIAISRTEHELDIEPSRSAERDFTKGELELIKDAFSRSFRKGDYDQGLLDAVAEIRRAAMRVGVRDHARMFSPEAVREADEALEAIRRKTPWGVVIETVETLGGKPLREAAVDNARAAQVHGLYVLIAKKEHKIYAEPSESAAKVFTREKVRKLEDVVSADFKEKAFDKGLRDAVVALRDDVAETPSAAASNPRPLAPARQAAPAGAGVPGPPSPVDPGVLKPAGWSTPMILLGGGALLVALWLIFRRPRSPQPESQPQPLPPHATGGGGSAPQPAPGTGYSPPPQPGVAPGYGPRPGPGAGYPPPPRPGVAPGYAPQAGPAPGYGAGPPPAGYGQGGYGAPAPPPQGGSGGGFMSGVLGGAAGALAGNILYDKFGRPHEGQGPVPPQGGVFPHQGGQPPDSNANIGGGPPPENYDPDAGVAADWGSPDQGSPVPDADQAGVGGDWGTPEPAAEAEGEGGDWGSASEEPAETGGDWGGGTEEPAEPGGDWGDGTDESADTGGDWGGGTDESADTGGDWGGGTDDQGGGGGDTEEQGGSW